MKKHRIIKSTICILLAAMLVFISFVNKDIHIYAADETQDIIELCEQTSYNYGVMVNKRPLTIDDIEDLNKLKDDAQKVLDSGDERLTKSQKARMNVVINGITSRVETIKSNRSKTEAIKKRLEEIPDIDHILKSYEDELRTMYNDISKLLTVESSKLLSIEDQTYLESCKKPVYDLIDRITYIDSWKLSISDIKEDIPDIDSCTEEDIEFIEDLKRWSEKLYNNYYGNLGTADDMSYRDELKENIKSADEKLERVETVTNLLKEVKELSEKLPATDSIKIEDKAAVASVKAKTDELLNKYSGNILEQDKQDIEKIAASATEKVDKVKELEKNYYDELHEKTIETYKNEQLKTRHTIDDVESLNKIKSDAQLLIDNVGNELSNNDLVVLNNAITFCTEKVNAVIMTDDAVNKLKEQDEKNPGIDTIQTSSFSELKEMYSNLDTLLLNNTATMSEAQETYLNSLKDKIQLLSDRLETVSTRIDEVKELSEKLPAIDSIKIEDKAAVVSVKSKADELLNKYSGNITVQDKQDIEKIAADATAKLDKIKELEDSKKSEDVVVPGGNNIPSDTSSDNTSDTYSDNTSDTSSDIKAPATGDCAYVYMLILMSMISGLGVIAGVKRLKCNR